LSGSQKTAKKLTGVENSPFTWRWHVDGNAKTIGLMVNRQVIYRVAQKVNHLQLSYLSING